MGICKPSEESFFLLWPVQQDLFIEDCLVYLLEPFIKHYAGTVFRLGAPSGISGWDEDIRIREKISFFDQRTYLLPDNGRGKPDTLPKNKTQSLPEEIWKNSDICLGPWRITSMNFVQGEINKDFDVLPLGQPPVVIDNTNGPHQKDLVITAGNYQCKVEEMLTKTKVFKMKIDSEDCIFPYNEWPPGFYNFQLTNTEGARWVATIIKMFPWYVASDLNHKIILEKTIW